MRTIRVFPRRTSCTPDDVDAFVGFPDLFVPRDDLRIEISVTFDWDKPLSEQLHRDWSRFGPTTVGGPAFDAREDEFVPGRYLKWGNVITSRGCPNKCWFCRVWKRNGSIRELPITSGWNVLDDNLLACSRSHVESVFAMLQHQPEPITFKGGLEAKLFQPWHIDLLARIKLKRLFCAFDTPDDLEPLIHAGRLLAEIGVTGKRLSACCYVLVGFPRDTFKSAEERCLSAWKAGFAPFPMPFARKDGTQDKEWKEFQHRIISMAYFVRVLQGRPPKSNSPQKQCDLCFSR